MLTPEDVLTNSLVALRTSRSRDIHSRRECQRRGEPCPPPGDRSAELSALRLAVVAVVGHVPNRRELRALATAPMPGEDQRFLKKVARKLPRQWPASGATAAAV